MFDSSIEFNEEIILLKEFCGALPSGIAIFDADFKYVWANDTLGSIHDEPVKDFVGKTIREALPDMATIVEPLVKRALDGERLINQDIRGSASHNGGLRSWRATYIPITRNGSVKFVGVILNDASAIVTAEAALRTRTELYEMLAGTHRIIREARSVQEIFDGLCRVALTTGHFHFAWVGVPDGREVKSVASAGDDNGYLDTIKISLDETDPFSQGPTGRAFREGKWFVANDFQSDPTTKPWRENAKLAGFGGSAAFPLLERGKVVAVLTLYAGVPDFFTDDLICALSEISPSVSFALDSFATEKERQLSNAALVESEARTRSILEGMPVLLNAFDKDRVPVAWNRECERVTGYSASEMIGNPNALDLIYPDAKQQDRLSGQWPESGQDFNQWEWTLTRKDGHRRTIAWSSVASKLTVPEWSTWGVGIDVTERNQAYYDLEASEARYSSLVANLDVGILLLDADRKLVFSNSAGQSILGLSPGTNQVISFDDPKWQLVREDETPFPSDQMPSRLAMQTGERVRDVPIGFSKLDTGERRWARVTATPDHDGDGHLEQILITIVDITDHKRQEAERLKLIAAIEQSGETVVITDKDGIIQYVNPAFVTSTGYTREEAIGQSPKILASGKQDDDFYYKMWQTIAAGEIWFGQFVNRRKDGTLYTEDANISPVIDPNGNIVNYVAIKRDITKQLKLEAQFRQAQKMESVGRLAGGVAHDFNNLLTVINGYSELLLNSVDGEHPMRASLEEIQQAGERSAALTKQLLAFSRRQVLAPAIIDLNRVVRDSEKMLKRLIGEDIELTTDLSSDIYPVKADPGQLEQVIFNLAVNARDAMPRGGRLKLATENVILGESYSLVAPHLEPGDYVQLSVSDSGTGMTPEVQENLFEPFFTTKSSGQGTGLGLAVVHGVVEQSGGYVEVVSELGVGSTFLIYFPRSVDHSAHLKRSAKQAEPPKGKETILLVEDDIAVQMLSREILQHCGYTVLVASTPEEALKIVKATAGSIDLLVTDVIMPEIAGPLLADMVSAITPDIKVMFISGYTNEAMQNHGIDQSKVNFLQKPFAVTDLANAVRKVLDNDNTGDRNIGSK